MLLANNSKLTVGPVDFQKSIFVISKLLDQFPMFKSLRNINKIEVHLDRKQKEK